MRFWGVKLIFLLLPVITMSQSYYLNTYGGASQSPGMHPLYLKSIDLESASVSDSLLLSERGYIYRKTPPLFNLNNKTYLISFIGNGGFAKNSDMDRYSVSYFVVEDSSGNLQMRTQNNYHDATIEHLDQYRNENGFRLDIRHSITDSIIMPQGLYKLNSDFTFKYSTIENMTHESGQLNFVGSHDYLLSLFSSGNRNIYYSFEGSHLTICRLDNSHTAILDSLGVYDKGQIFAFHPGRDKFYRFYLNYEIHGKFPEYEKNYDDDRIIPEILIYDAVSFDLLERHTIADYPRGDYPGPESGPADVVGDYIVYYFFEDDWIGKYAPAMLFIFDTRTNEATWLRVGWR